MKIIKYTALGLLGLMILFAVGGLFLPSAQSIERQITINAPAARIFPYLNDLHQFNRWSPWAGLDPDMQFSYSGAEQGVGAEMQWRSKYEYSGRGAQKIVESDLNKRVKSTLDFGFGAPASATLSLQEQGDKTVVTWTFYTYMGNTILRYFGLMMDNWVGSSYEQGLASLKKLVESDHG